MGLPSIFGPKRSKPASSKSDVKPVEEKKDASPEDAPERSLKLTNAVYPFQDAKATSFPPLLSIDASVFTDRKSLMENMNEKKDLEQAEKEKRDEIKSDKIMLSTANETCDSITCTKENCSTETCENTLKKQQESREKIDPVELTEMINSSIKEAVETIVKQCRMEDKKDPEKKGKKEELDNSDCFTKKEETPAKSKQFDCSRYPRNDTKTSRLQEKYLNLRSAVKKSHDENAKSHARKESAFEDGRTKRHSKPANSVRTDNRRMTGNVNIYICSEATETTQSNKQKKAPPCAETRSETTTDQSSPSTSNLESSIRKIRRKSKERDSLDFLPKRKGSSCVCEYTDSNATETLESTDLIDVCAASDDIISTKNKDSSLIEFQCKDTNVSNSDATTDKSDSALPKAKFVVCDKLVEPCATIYPLRISSSTESEKWSSRSICGNVERSNYDQGLEADGKRVLGEETDVCSNYYASNLRRDYDTGKDEEGRARSRRNFRKICECHKKDRSLLVSCDAQSGYKDKRRKKRSACSCIAEEEEEEEEQDASVCRKALEDSRKQSTNVVTCPADSRKSIGKLAGETLEDAATLEDKVKEGDQAGKDLGAEKEEKIGEKTVERKGADQRAIRTGMYVPPRLMKPEVRALKYILTQRERSPSQPIARRSAISPLIKTTGKPEELTEDKSDKQSEQKTKPAFLKKFNLPVRRVTEPIVKKESLPMKTTDKKLKIEEDKEEATEEKLKESFILRLLKAIFGKKARSEVQSKEDKIAEDSLTDSTRDNVEIPKTEKHTDQLPKEFKTEIKETQQRREKFIPPKIGDHKINEKKNKIKDIIASKMLANKENENPAAGDATPKSLDFINKETVKEDRKEDTERMSKLLIDLSNKKLPVSSIRGTSVQKDIEKSTEESKVKKKLDDQEKQQPESQEAIGQDEIASKQKTDTEERSSLDLSKKEATCVQCSRRKSSMKAEESSHMETESHTVCRNSKSIRRISTNEDFPMNDEELERNGHDCCCCLSATRGSNELTSYPKSCLKKGKQFYRICSQENNLLTSCHDNRIWKECACRRVVLCDNCCRPRNECSCRLAITCLSCCKPKTECNCKPLYDNCKCMKSMFCLYCDNPREKCACRAPIKKCSCCELPMDVCMCEGRKNLCEGRPVSSEPENERTMFVTAWKPREEVRRYFSRNLADRRVDSINECRCHEKLKSHNSDDLPYQRLSVFSDVMNELQQKMSESSCCTQCRKIPCCCNAKLEEGKEDRKIKCYTNSPKSRRKILTVCTEKSKWPNVYCKCETGQAKNEKLKKIVIPLCCACKTTPCRCKKPKSSQKKPKAKCYYCKNSPCVCIAARERNKPRPCRCADSPCRAKEKEITPYGKTKPKPKNEEKIVCIR